MIKQKMYSYVIETNYGYGWEVESTYDNLKEALNDITDYQILTEHYGGSARIKRIPEE